MLTKPADEDSDDEPENVAAAAAAQDTTAVTSAKAKGAVVGSPSPPAESSESLATGLQKVSISNPSTQEFGELDKLRDRQRTEIYKNHRQRQAAGLPTPGIYGDLAGLNFDPLQAPMDPKHAVETRDPYGQGNLSDYSDYSYARPCMTC